MTTTTQPADLLALQRLSDACLSRRLTPDECSEFQTAISSLAAHRGEVEEMSPEFTDTARAALLWVLWHHQGGSSEVGQPIRFALGMGAHEPLAEHQVKQAKYWATLTNRAHPPQAQADPDEEMATNVWKRTEAYIRGYEDGKLDATQAQAGAGDAWIAVFDQLPSDGEYVDVWGKPLNGAPAGRFAFVRWLGGSFRFPAVSDGLYEYGQPVPADITHWRPLPAPPALEAKP